MRSASYRSSSYSARASLRSRLGALGGSLAIVLAILAALVWLGAPIFVPMRSQPGLSTFDVQGERQSPSPDASQAPTPEKTEQKEKALETPRTPPPPAPPPVVQTPFTLPGVISMSRADFAATDVGRIKSDPGLPTQAADAGGASGGGPKGIGKGPDGNDMFAAEWYREPTRAELVTYMPQRQQEGWGMIACKTIDRFHVDDCHELGESHGSGIARGLRQAAWQFLVRPPQLNGKPMLGVWVRIRFDLVRGVSK